MGRSKNRRSKEEGSFLEHVKSLLQQLQEDITQIKSRINDGSSYPWTYCQQHAGEYAWQECQTGVLEPGCEETELLYWLNVTTEGHRGGYPWDVLAPEFVPSGGVPITRTAMLDLRFACGPVDKPDKPNLPRAGNMEVEDDDGMASKALEDPLPFFMKPSVGTWLAVTSTFGSEGPQQYMHWQQQWLKALSVTT